MVQEQEKNTEKKSRFANIPKSVVFVLGILVVAGLLWQGGRSETANRNPTGEIFPTVVGQSLEEEGVTLPAGVQGGPSILLVGYLQESQFDIDRWVMGFLQAELDVQLLEVPTLPGLVPSFISGWIDDGMRSGIPQEDWSLVVTVYGDAAKPIAEFTGTENGRLARILLLDENGRVLWFDDKGYSPRKVLAIRDVLNSRQVAEESAEGFAGVKGASS